MYLAKTKSLHYPHNLFREIGINDIMATDDMIRNLETLLSNESNILNEKEKKAVTLYFKEGLSMQQIAGELERSLERIRQILYKALHILRHPAHVDYIRTGGETRRLESIKEEIRMAEIELQRIKKEIKDLTEKQPEMKGYATPDVNEKAAVDIMDEAVLHQVPRPSDLALRHMDFYDACCKFNISTRAYNMLKRAGVDNMYQLSLYSIKDLLKVRNAGRKSVGEITSMLERFSIQLPYEIEDELDEPVDIKFRTRRLTDFIHEHSLYTYRLFIEGIKGMGDEELDDLVIEFKKSVFKKFNMA